MTDHVNKSKLPFKIVSSSVNTGYAAELSSSFKPGTDIVNLHKDIYGGLENEPLQSPFTKEHVGGEQHRHIPVNTGADNDFNRPESFKINANASSLRIYGPDFENVNKPRAQMWRGAKSPVNIANIQTSGNIAGNFQNNYEVVQSVGRGITNNLLADDLVASGTLTTQFITGAHNYSLPDIKRVNAAGIEYKDKTVIVQRFNSPGGKEESSRGTLDRAGEELAPNNSLTTRNIKVRQPFYRQLTQHAAQFNSGSTNKLLPDVGTTDAVTLHAVNRNTLKRIELSGTNDTIVSGAQYDNFWIQHSLPRTDYAYSWITGSSTSNPYTVSQPTFSFTASLGNLGSINLQTQTLESSLSASDKGFPTWKQIRTGEHPVAQKLKQTNNIAVEDTLSPITLQNGSSVVPKRSQTSTNYREPLITNKYFPIEQDVEFVGEAEDTGTRIKYSFGNISNNFANNNLNIRLGLTEKQVPFYNKILDAKDDAEIIKTILSLKYKEKLFPRSLNTFLEETRSRTEYILDQPGFDRDGYDRQLGTQRVYWRDQQQNRKRSANSAGGHINSLGYSSLEESGSNFTQNDNGILFNNTLINHSASLSQNFTNLNAGLNNSIIPLESNSQEKEIYTYTGSFEGTFYKQGNIAVSAIANIVKRSHAPEIGGEFNNTFVDFYEQFLKNNQKQSIGAVYRNTLYKQMINALPEERSEIVDVITKTDDESVFSNPKPRYVSFIGGGELNTGSLFDNSNNFSNNYQNVFLFGTNSTVKAIAETSDKIYFGGFFTVVGTVAANRIFSYDKNTGTVSSLGTGLNSGVDAITVSGSDIYVGGDFTTAGGNPAKGIARWDTITNTWSVFASSFNIGSSVKAIAVSGSDIYVGGSFSESLGSPANNIARWSTTTNTWSALSGGVDSSVNAIAVSGSDIYVGGNFLTANGSPANYIARWNTTTNTWSALSGGLDDTVTTIAVSGSDIYVGGNFFQANGNPANYIARWNTTSSSWSALGSGVSSVIRTITVSGSDIYLGGDFTTAGGNPASRLALYNTSTQQFEKFNPIKNYNTFSKNLLLNSLNESDIKFSTLDSGLINQKINNPTKDSIDEYYKSDIYQAAKDYSIIPEFKISQQLPDLQNNYRQKNNQFLQIDGAKDFYKSADSKTSSINKQFLENYSFTDTLNKEQIENDYSDKLKQDKININVSAVKKLLPYNGFYPQERTLQIANLYNDYVDNVIGGGTFNLNNLNDYYNNRILSGNFTGSLLAVDVLSNIDASNYLNKYYVTHNTSVRGLNSSVNTIAVSGSDIYIGGLFSTAGGNPANRIARWNTTTNTWFSLGSLTLGGGVSSFVNAIAVSGSDIYVGGSFTTADGNSANRIARWNTTTNTWSALSGGVDLTVRTITVSGSDIYVGGDFSLANGNPANRIARWSTTSSSWSALGSGVSSVVRAIAVSGSDIYVGGSFTTAGGNPASRIARWNTTSSSWSALSGGVNNLVRTIAVSGSDIYVGGLFTTANSNPANYIARWNTTANTWSPLGTGLNVNSIAFAIAVSGSDICVGGDFTLEPLKKTTVNYIAIYNSTANNFVALPDNASYVYSSSQDSYKQFDQAPILTEVGYDNSKFISASNGLNLYSFLLPSHSSSLFNRITTDGSSFSTPSFAVGPVSIGDGFGQYWDYVYENNEQEKILFAIGSPTLTTGSKSFAGAVSFVSATMRQFTNGQKYWEYSNKIILGTGSAQFNGFGTGVSMLSCSSGYQVFMGEILGDTDSTNFGNIWVVTSSNGINWSQPVSILSGSVPSSSLGFNNIKAVNYTYNNISKSYLYFSEPLSSGSDNVEGKFFVISSSDNNNWGNTNINSQKTELYSQGQSATLSGTLFDITGSNKNSIKVYSGDGFMTYCFVNGQDTSADITEIVIGSTSDGINWQTNDQMFKQQNDNLPAHNAVGMTTYTQNNQTLPVFFTNISSSAGLASIYAIANNQYTQYTLNVTGTEKYVKQAALEPLMAPGILYNTIKSGIAVDWPAITGSELSIQPYGSGTVVNAYYPQSFKMASHIGQNINELNIYGNLRSNIDYRIDFEKIIFPDDIFIAKQELTSSLIEATTTGLLGNNSQIKQFISGCYIYGGYEPYTSPVDFSDYNQVGPKRFSIPFVYRKQGEKDTGLYSMAISNFLAETVKFFLKDQLLTNFQSIPDSEWGAFDSTKTYYMDVVVEKVPELVMMEAYHSNKHPIGPKGQKMNGRYFGYPVNKTNKKLWSQQSEDLFTEEEAKLIHNDPAYAPYTPPYFEGTAILRLSFKPEFNVSYKLDDILNALQVEDIFSGLESSADLDSDAYKNKMGIESSLNVRGRVPFVDTTRGDQNSSTTNTSINSWIIGTKMETPVLDFSSQQTIQDSNDYLKTSGFGRGMWSGYGEIPNEKLGVYVSLAESFPQKYIRNKSTEQSLLQKVGFTQTTKKVGVLAETKDISEALMIIPFIETSDSSTETRRRFHGGRLTDFEKEAGIQFIGIDKDIYGNVIKENLNSSILNTYNSMGKFIVPPQFDYKKYTNINPFVAYIVEFEHTLQKQDLADIWQGVAPRIANVAELQNVNISHSNSKTEFFHGEGMPNNIRFMVFKIKQKGESNYFKVTKDSSDDLNFSFEQKIGRSIDDYSYNWPYDYFSLVELAKIDVQIEYKKKEEE